MNSSNNLDKPVDSSGLGKDNPTDDIGARLEILEKMFQRMDDIKDPMVYNTILIEKLSTIIDISVTEILNSGSPSPDMKIRLTALSELIKVKLKSLLQLIEENDLKRAKIEKRDKKSKKRKKTSKKQRKKWKKKRKKWRKKVNKKAKKKVKNAEKKADKKSEKEEKKTARKISKDDKNGFSGLNNNLGASVNNFSPTVDNKAGPNLGNLAGPSIKIFQKEKEKVGLVNPTVVDVLIKKAEVMI